MSKLSVSTANPNIVAARYAVRGAIVARASALDARLRDSEDKASLPFTKIIHCNIGNPQKLGQPALSFARQVLALIVCPSLMDESSPTFSGGFPPDAVKRARDYLAACPPGVGAYSNSQGLSIVRQEVARFISERDGGLDVSADHIFLTDGASRGVKMWLSMLVRSASDGVMVPVPQYPLYSASLTLFGGSLVSYELNEDDGWGITVDALRESVERAQARGIQVRALVVINPGNPTGQCLTLEQLQEIVRFCEERDIIIMADEVYQVNVYPEDMQFVSFRKAAALIDSKAQIVSFHSTSKGVVGECGARGGYFEMHNFDDEVRALFYKLAATSLCPNLYGQFMTGLMVNPPKPGDPSYEQYQAEHQAALDSLTERAARLSKALDSIDGISCNTIQGALYAFPQIMLPAGAVAEAEKRGQAPDEFFCFELLDNTGICTVPGSGFLQKEGTFHFRTTILPRHEDFDYMIDKIGAFAKDFFARYQS